MKFLTLTAVALSLVAARTPATRIEPAARPRALSFHHDGVLGTSADFRFVSTSPSAANRAHAIALAEIERLRLVLSSWDDKSELARLFAQGSLDHPSTELLAVLNAYTDWNTRTGHAYSARVGALKPLWQQAAAQGVAPDAEQLATIAREIAKPAWRVEAGRVVALTTQRPDLNSLGKGFIIDHALQVVRDSVPEIKGVLVNIGGDIHVWGTPADGGTWHVNVANPQSFADNAAPLARLALRGGAVSSSGDYQRGFNVGARHY
ncbi:MAG: FAD:protein FMN transferase, partial [Gemmatimonadaceae bacterium]